MLVEHISSRTKFAAWKSGVQHLVKKQRRLSVLLDISAPLQEELLTPQIIDKFLAAESQPLMTHRSEGIFPNRLYQRHGLRGVFDVYPEEVYPLQMKSKSQIKFEGDIWPPLLWGDYAYRLVRREQPYGQLINPLETIINKLKSELSTGHPKRSCYEISMCDIPVFNNSTDAHFRRGGPCLMHLSFHLAGGALHLTALYRNHDYAYIVPGNLLGLTNLMECVAEEIQENVGHLVVHSSHALLAVKSSVRQFLQI